MLSPFAPFRTVLSEAKELRVNFAKHLLFLVENKQKQIPRSARDDIVGAFFISLQGWRDILPFIGFQHSWL